MGAVTGVGATALLVPVVAAGGVTCGAAGVTRGASTGSAAASLGRGLGIGA